MRSEAPSCTAAAQKIDRIPHGDRRDGSLRIGNYVVRPAPRGWVVATVKAFRTGSQRGEEYETDLVYPGHFDQALRTLLDLLVRDGIEPDTSLERAVMAVAFFYAAIGHQTSEFQRR